MEIANANKKIVEAQGRIDKVEEHVQNLEQVLNKVIKVMHQQENKLLDHEGRSRRENLRIYNVPKGTEKPSMMDFVDKLLRDTLKIPASVCLRSRGLTTHWHRNPPETGMTAVNNSQIPPLQD